MKESIPVLEPEPPQAADVLEERKPEGIPQSASIVFDSPDSWRFTMSFPQMRWGETWGKCSC